MNSTLDMLLGLYISSAGSSMLMNIYINQSLHKNAKKESYKNLKYKKGMSFKAKKKLGFIYNEYVFDTLNGMLVSFVPVWNVLSTINNILEMKEDYNVYKSLYNEIIEKSNDIEEQFRRKNYLMLKEIKGELKELPKEVDLEDNSTELTKKETKKILKLNKKKYNKEMLKYERNHKEI